jgi:hypothetical protein
MNNAIKSHDVIALFDRRIATLTKQIVLRRDTPNSKRLIELRAVRQELEALKAELTSCIIPGDVTERLEPADKDTMAIARRFAPD